ncbi:MAG: MBL fold metallo-hydrolase [Candidatus Heimdallarchaeaceae archaeon]
MVSITFYGAINEIGGNKILIEGTETRVFLDFGLCFNRYGNYFSPYITPRQGLKLKDFIELNLLPDLEGLYRQDFEQRFRESSKEPLFDGVVLSHPHIDHAGFIPFIRSDIPFYASEGSLAILKAIEQTSQGFYEFLKLKEKFKIRESKREKGKYVRDKDSSVQREITTFKSSFKIGEFTFHPFSVDHSIVGATAYVIETSEGAVVYTGDIRFHGRKYDLSWKFVEEASKYDPILMITEGTRIHEQTTVTELQLEDNLKRIIKEISGLVVASFPVRDFDRMQSFVNAGKENGRELVISTRQAFALDVLEKEKIDDVPNLDEVRVFLPSKSWGIYDNPNYPIEIQMQDYSTWERKIIEKSSTITANEIREEQESYILRVEPTELKYLLDINPKIGSRYIRSLTEPVDEEMEIQQQKMDNWLKFFSLYPYKQLHCSGHTSRKELLEMINKINPKKIVPIHTENAKDFMSAFEKVMIVEEGVKITLK